MCNTSFYNYVKNYNAL